MYRISARYRRRIWNSFQAAVVGWGVSLVLVVIGFVTFAMHAAVVESAGAPARWEIFFALFAVGFLSLFPLMIACICSAVITFIGWVLLGLPLALLISERGLRSLGGMVTLHVAATIAYSALIVLTWPGGSNSGELMNLLFQSWWGYWGMALGAVGGATFWRLNRARSN